MGKRVKYIVTLTTEERQSLTRLIKAGKTQVYRIKHASILLAADANGHSKICWREEILEQAILDDLATLRMPSQEIAEWFRASVQAAFADIDELQCRQKQTLLKRKTELASMQERLLNAFLSGAIDEEVLQAKSASLKREMAQVEESLEQAKNYDSDAPVRALAVFDFSQNLVSLWQRSNSTQKREILDCVSLNLAVDSASLCLTKRKPFDFLAERPFLEESRGDWIRTSDLLTPSQAL